MDVEGHSTETDVLTASTVLGSQPTLGTREASLLVGAELLGSMGVAGAFKGFLSRARWAVLDFELGTASWHGQLVKGHSPRSSWAG